MLPAPIFLVLLRVTNIEIFVFLRSFSGSQNISHSQETWKWSKFKGEGSPPGKE